MELPAVMHVEKTERQISELMSQISAGEIRLPELQRDYVWKPPHVAKLVDSLYRGYPLGSLLFWQTDSDPARRSMAVKAPQHAAMRAPLYLLDGQQRLTSLHRVFTDQRDAQVVFHVGEQRFQNQSATTRADARWVKVYDLVSPDSSMLGILRGLLDAGLELDEREIERRITRVRNLGERSFHLEILKDFPYEEIAEIFVRVNSAGRRLNTLDLATATLSSRRRGTLRQLEAEADRWREMGFGGIDVNFLSRAFTGAVLGRGLSAWSHGKLAGATDAQLDDGWETVRTGLARLIPLLRDTLGVTRSDVLPSMIALIPLVVLLGERPADRLDEQTTDGILYWLLVAMATSRYSGSTDTLLGRDIQAAREADPVRALLGRLLIHQGRPRVTAETLSGRTKDGRHAFLALLAVRRRGARDWWHGTELLSPNLPHAMAQHRLHPTRALASRHRPLAAELANHVFVSMESAAALSAAASTADHLAELGTPALSAHCIPTDPELHGPERVEDFLAARRAELAGAINDLLDHFEPEWVGRFPDAGGSGGPTLTAVHYGSAWDPGVLRFVAAGPGLEWSGVTDAGELDAAISAVVDTRVASDIEIAGQSVPVDVAVEGDAVTVAIGPYDVTGPADLWRRVLEDRRRSARAPGRMPDTVHTPWNGERAPLDLAVCR
ncbi:DUF262 domain-containing protein [Pseudonocardia nematodicida]|uniref:DUF262 domain-containing protein n=1 Tax=Pseudonocardia nematodicida TaxID=1206997 RepID=A0ABV1K6N8_9PSEU